MFLKLQHEISRVEKSSTGFLEFYFFHSQHGFSRVLSGLRLMVLNPIKHSCSFFKHYLTFFPKNKKQKTNIWLDHCQWYCHCYFLCGFQIELVKWFHSVVLVLFLLFFEAHREVLTQRGILITLNNSLRGMKGGVLPWQIFPFP